MRILIENVGIVPMTGNNLVLEKGHIVIENDRIKEIAEERPGGDYDKIIDGTNRMAIPGFINAHTHAAMTLLRGYADDLPLMEWLETKIWPLESKMTADDIYWGTMLAATEMIKSGTTCFADMYFYMDKTAQAVDKSGMRAVLARGMIGIGPEAEQGLIDSRELVQKWNGSGDGRISFMLGPHAPYTCPPDYLKRVMDMAGELGIGMHIHLAETATEMENIKATYGKTPVAHLNSLGMFNFPVLAAHCVHLTEEDIAVLAKNKVSVVHNPESNMKLASGIAPVPEMLQAGIPVAIGTDGASSNNNLDMLQEMRSCAFLHKVNTFNPTAIPAYKALEMATLNGARALWMDKELGKIQPGYKADIVLISLQEAHMIPRYDIIANLVYSAQAADVQTVIINGKIIMEDRVIKTFDEKEVLQQAKEIAQRLANS